MRLFKLLATIAFLLSTVAGYCYGSEKIAPTRTLDGRAQPGQLSVFSEPPGLEITLNGKSAGMTPLHEIAIAGGIHTLKIENTQTTITITSGEVRQLSYFKGKFVDIPVPVNDPEETPSVDQQTSRREALPESAPEKEETLQPGYFPLKPGGRIY